ncbi:FecCD family ABC transporter permease [Vallitalea sp.]|jgi:iron complex transport system permease protein|uniref:FecCD family ABC transporter permease n=1 Tax=Vallitalea sp. TaxID=1882829 RepID=UPI0025F442AE|nr:iron ABC transporter permease [Vallitalea sp.]MCT4687774.1 iron ABC transporter permease [Vallitalea sp.]
MNEFKNRHSYKITILIILLIVTFISFLFSISLGAFKISVPEILKAIFIDETGVNRNIICKVRVPRSLVAGTVGICLSLAGGILQGVMRNPLASPNTIGVSSGAGLGAVFILVVFPDYDFLVTPIAFAFALFTTMLIYILSWKNGIKPLRMILAGIAVSSFLGAFINTILIFYPDRVQNALGFMVGSLAAKTWKDFYALWPYALFGLIIAFILSKKLNILMLGDEIATGLGLKIENARKVFIALASLLAASSASNVGLLGFVGLIVPHITRLIIGSDYRYLFPASALLGASLMMFCDTIARIVMDPVEIPVGIVMSMLGAPFFIFLLRGGLKNRVKN